MYGTLFPDFRQSPVSKLHYAARDDAEVSVAFLKVVNMLAPPPSILRPSIMWRVLRGNLWPHQGTSAAEPAQVPAT